MPCGTSCLSSDPDHLSFEACALHHGLLAYGGRRHLRLSLHGWNAGRKSRIESFAGASITYTIEGMMGDGRALQVS